MNAGWRWDQLKRIGNSRTANLITLLPYIAFGLAHLDIVNRLIPNLQLRPEELRSLYFLFLGLLSLSVGNLLFAAYAPYQVTRYIDDVDYYLSEKGCWWKDEEKDVLSLFPETYAKEAKLVDQRGEIDGVKVVRFHYRFLAASAPVARLAVSALYVAGFTLTSIPVLKNTTVALRALLV